MANWKKVDADQLDADLTSVADTIRERAGISEKLDFPSEYKSAVEGIPKYDEQILAGTIAYYKNETVTNLRGSAFSNCQQLSKVVLPKVVHAGSYTFQNGFALLLADFSSAITIGANSFVNCTKLGALVLRSATMATLADASAFSLTPIKSGGTGYIYVPRALLSDTDATKDYRQATNWSAFASQFRALEDYTMDGTTTGEFFAWQSGALNPNGGFGSNTARLRSVNFVPNTATNVTANNGYQVLAVCFDDEYKGLAAPYWTDNGPNSSGQWYTSLDLDAVFSRYKNIRLMLRRTDNGAISESEGENLIFTFRNGV